MKAAVIRRRSGRKVLLSEDVPQPAPGPGQVLIKVSRSGICGSDLHGFLDATGTARADGLIMGHETSGTIAALGKGISGLSTGERVTVDPQVSCGRCPPCRNGWISICEHKRVTGSSQRGFVQGSMAEYLAADAHQVYPVPPEISDAASAMIEPLANALHVLNRAGDPIPEVAVVLGCGPLGLCVIQGLRARGADTVIATDLSPGRLQLGKQLGADVIVDAHTESLEQVVRDLSPRGADLVVESVGVSPTYSQAINVARKRGRVMFFGAIQPTVALPLLPILHKELHLIGCTGANDETNEAIDLVATGVITLEPMLTHTFDLDHAQQGLDVLSDPDAGAIKVQVTP